jgi:hypothetical protein
MENKRAKYWQKLIYASQWDTAFIELILMKTKSLNKFLWTFLAQNFIQIERKSGNRAKFHLLPKLKYRFNSPIFHETHTCLITLCENLMYRISPKSLKKYGQYRYKFIHVLK